MKKLVIISIFISAGITAGEWDKARAAILSGYFEPLQKALSNDPNIINQRSSTGGTLLHTAIIARSDDHGLVEFLLMRGIDINAQDALGDTALMEAVDYGNDATVELLLRHGADIDIRNNRGQRVSNIRPGKQRSLRSDDPRVINIKRLLQEAKLKKDKEAQEKKQKATSAPRSKL